MNDSYSVIRTSFRSVAETMPAVTEWSKPSGLPMASTQSPMSSLSESPHSAWTFKFGLDLEDGEVGLGVGADQPGRHVVAGAEPDQDLVGVLDDVVVGDDVAFCLVDDDARAQLRLWSPGVMRLPPSGSPGTPRRRGGAETTGR